MKRSNDFTPFRECDYCHMGIGKTTYNSQYIPGQYCSSECYVNALMQILNERRLNGD